MNLDYQQSQEIAQLIDAKIGQCYYNAFRALSLVSSGALYVQGLATSPKLGYIPLDHGWVEYEGKIIDPTWFDMIDVHYHPIQKWTWGEVTAIVSKQPTLPLRLTIKNEDYAQAHFDFIDKLNDKD